MSAPDSSLYAEGTRAINQAKWADAEAIFAKVAAQQGTHADLMKVPGPYLQVAGLQLVDGRELRPPEEASA